MVKYILAAFIACLMLTSQLSAQAEKRCSLISKKCINANEFQDKSFTVPENVTRFNKDGLTFCLEEVEDAPEPVPPAVIFVIDHSTSMKCNYDGDTCGDPNSVRGPAVIQAIEKLKEVSPGAAAGVVEFAWDLSPVYQKKLGYLSDDTHFNELVSSITTHEIAKPSSVTTSTTNYDLAIKETQKFLDDFNDGDVQEYVIFITDGKPSVGETNRDVLVSWMEKFPETHPVFIGDSTHLASEADTLFMKRIADASKDPGEFHLINSAKTNGLADSLVNIVLEFVHRGSPQFDQVKMTKSSSSGTVSKDVSTENFIKDGQISWAAQFPFGMPLDIGSNDIALDISYTNIEAENFSFSIEIEKGEYGTSIDSEFWELDCYDWSSIDFVDDKEEPVGFYVGDSDPMYIQLITEEHEEDDTDITWTRISNDDSVTKKTTRDGEVQPSGQAFYNNSVALDIEGDQTNWKVKDNSTLEVHDLDTIIASWIHPSDPRDFAYDTTFVFDKNALDLSMDPNKGSTIIINASDIGSTSKQLVITLTFPDDPQVLIPADQTNEVGFYSVSHDLEERLFEYNNQDITIYGEFEDHTGKMIYDTLELKVRLPLWPEYGALYDRDGDGQADYVKYFFPGELSRDQEFDTHEIFWASDTASETYIIGDDYADRDEFGIALSPQLEYGITRGYKSDGTGLAVVCVVYKSVPDCNDEIELRDSIGPVVLSAWIMKNENVLKLVTSEPLDADGSEDEYVYRIRNGKESSPDLVGGKQDDISTYEWLISLDPNDPEISVGDSVKLAFGNDAAFTDLTGNYAHSDNAPVRVQLDLTGDANLLLNILRSVVDYSPEESEEHVEYVLARQERLEEMRTDGDDEGGAGNADESFLVYWNNVDDGELSEVHDDDDGFSKPAGSVDRFDTTAVVGPTFTLDIELPHYDGMASRKSDSALGLDQRKSIEEEITIEFTCMFYDQLGQYIGKRHNKMLFEDASMFNELEQMSLLFEWMPEVKDGKLQIASSSGRYIPTGVIIAVAKYTAVGVVKEDFPPLKKGDSRSASETQVIRFGYIRQ